MAGSKNNFFRKTFIMMWKNVLLRKRHYIQTALEIILPTLLFVILVAIHSTGDNQNSNGEKTNVIEAKIPLPKLYPIDYCTSLIEMIESEKDDNDNDDSKHFTVLGRQIYYTNVPGDEDKDEVNESSLVQDIMKSVQNTVNYFLLPCCTLISNHLQLNVTLELTENGILGE